jgi:hypothetical protein
MLNHPDTESPTPSSGKLVLPDPSDEEQRVASGQHSAQIHPGLLIRQTMPPAPTKVLPKLVWYWRKDPAYKVFMIAIAMVVVASLVFVSLVSAALFDHSSPGAGLSQTPGKVTPGGTVDLHPTFPKPTGGNGSNQSSQPPAQSTPVVGPGDTPTAGPTVTTQPGGSLTLQITGYPSAVPNGSRVDITVSTNQPGVQVYLEIQYSHAQPSRALAGPGTTDANGNVTIPWSVFVFSFDRKNVQATLRAIGTDQNGQQVVSPPVVVQVTFGFGAGG